jgi:uncharacterized PurR-regulated membrane protein YhhQ (DUF165 family)
MLTIAILIYAAAMTVANLTIAHFGPWVSPINAFLLIGLDLALRDWLQVRMKAWQMGALIACTGLLTYALNPAAGTIAVASACAFSIAALVDWGVFSAMHRYRWIHRSLLSNTVAAVVDSHVFALMAFGVTFAPVVAWMFLAKVAGGAVWAALLARTVPREADAF